jgi:alkylhydroperoxidase family enzyme
VGGAAAYNKRAHPNRISRRERPAATRKDVSMPRIRPLDPNETTPEARAVLERFLGERGNIPNMFRTMARRPALMETAAAHMRAIFETGTVETRLKEMLAVRVSQINHCNY